MTEDDAKTKWCPFVRHDTEGINPGAFNRTNNVSSQGCNLNCIGSGCMAWRWDREYVKLPHDATDMMKACGLTQPSTTKGYCGLASKP